MLAAIGVGDLSFPRRRLQILLKVACWEHAVVRVKLFRSFHTLFHCHSKKQNATFKNLKKQNNRNRKLDSLRTTHAEEESKTINTYTVVRLFSLCPCVRRVARQPNSMPPQECAPTTDRNTMQWQQCFEYYLARHSLYFWKTNNK